MQDMSSKNVVVPANPNSQGITCCHLKHSPKLSIIQQGISTMSPNHEKEKKKETEPWPGPLFPKWETNNKWSKQPKPSKAMQSKAKAAKDAHTNHNHERPAPPPHHPKQKHQKPKFGRRRNQEKAEEGERRKDGWEDQEREKRLCIQACSPPSNPSPPSFRSASLLTTPLQRNGTEGIPSHPPSLCSQPRTPSCS